MNFFKHADRDPHDVIEFNPGISEGFMLFSIIGLLSLGEQLSDIQHAFLFWSRLHKPNLFSEDGEAFINRLPVEHIASIRQFDKREFFEAFLLAKVQHGRLG